MMDKKDILKMVRHVARRSHGKPDKRLIHPKRDWLIGIGLFLVIVVAGSLYNAYVYYGLTALEKNIVASETQVIRYQQNTVEQALNEYQKRQVEFAERKEALGGFTAPEVSTTTEATSSEGDESEIEESETPTDLIAE